MTTISNDYRTEAQDAYRRATFARTEILGQLNDIRAGQSSYALLAAGVSREEVGAAFETVWNVASFYERQLHADAEAERKSNQVITDELLSRATPAPVSATDSAEAGDRS